MMRDDVSQVCSLTMMYLVESCFVLSSSNFMGTVSIVHYPVSILCQAVLPTYHYQVPVHVFVGVYTSCVILKHPYMYHTVPTFQTRYRSH